MELADLLMKKEELCDELKGYLFENEHFLALKHPLVFSVPYCKELNALHNRQLIEKRKALDGAIAENNYNQYIWLHERPYRLDAFMLIHEKLDDKGYWELLSSVWTDSENVWENLSTWKTLPKSNRPGKKYFMSEGERKALKALPDKVRVFRGYQPVNMNRNGISYTLDKERAKWFSNRYRQKGVIRSRVVSKDEIFAYLSGRNEQEIIILD